MRRFAILCVLAGFAAGLASASTPYLVRDIDPLPLPQSSAPRDITSLGPVAVFSALGAETGAEPWGSDGTAAGTFLLADVCPGPCSSAPRDFVPTGDGRAFFLAGDSLWVTRGTPVSTFQLTTAPTTFAPSGSLRSSLWVPAQGRLYFAADDGADGIELWSSDGTATGTFQVADIRPGAAGSAPGSLAFFQNRVFFGADGGRGRALWVSDGTERGTRLVKGGPSSLQDPVDLRPLGKLLLFRAFSRAGGFEIWKSDGTARGTAQLADIAPGATSASPGPFTVLGGRLLFPAGDRRRGHELWATDGTPAGTRPLTSLPGLGAPVGEGTPRFTIGRRALFFVDDAAHGVEPWVTDGTPAGTRLLADICPGACSSVDVSASVPAVLLGNRLFLPLANARGRELWSTDGTPAGTRLAKDVCAGACNSRPRPLAAARGRVLFVADDGRQGPEVWASNGAPRGTVRLTDLDVADPFGDFLSAAVLPSAVLFTAGDGTHGRELWRSDTTAAGTELLADLATGDRGGSFPCGFLPSGGRLWFLADDGERARLWTSDGTFEGTRSVLDLPGSRPVCAAFDNHAAEAAGRTFLLLHTSSSLAPDLWVSDGTPAGTQRLTSASTVRIIQSRVSPLASHVLFFAEVLGQGTTLWRSDGTAAGTVQVEDLAPGSNSSVPREPTIFQGRLYFVAGGGLEGDELWTSDGTADGTLVLADLVPGAGSSDPAGLAVFGNRLYFFADTGTAGRSQLWSTDGTAAGTRLALDLDGFRPPIPAGDRMYLFAAAPGGPSGLQVTDGTPDGTRFLGEIAPSPRFGEIPPVAVGGRLYFAGPGATTEMSRLWTSDGTPEGTRPVAGSAGEEILAPILLRPFAGRLVVLTALDGNETLWESDGTAAGTGPLLSLAAPPEPPPDWPGTALAVAGERLFFPAYAPESGTELWALAPE